MSIKKNVPQPKSKDCLDAIEWLIANVNRPFFDSIASTDGSDIAKIWCTLLTLNIDKLDTLDDDDYGHFYRSIIRRIRPFLPTKYQNISINTFNGERIAESSKAVLDRFIDWYRNCIQQLQAELIQRYANDGFKQKQALDILERRWKSIWSNNGQRSIEVKQTKTEDDQTLTINFIDAN